jgi:hypothetical protein
MTEEEYKKRICIIDNLVRSYEISLETAGKLMKKLQKEVENKEKIENQ